MIYTLPVVFLILLVPCTLNKKPKPNARTAPPWMSNPDSEAGAACAAAFADSRVSSARRVSSAAAAEFLSWVSGEGWELMSLAFGSRTLALHSHRSEDQAPSIMSIARMCWCTVGLPPQVVPLVLDDPALPLTSGGLVGRQWAAAAHGSLC